MCEYMVSAEVSSMLDCRGSSLTGDNWQYGSESGSTQGQLVICHQSEQTNLPATHWQFSHGSRWSRRWCRNFVMWVNPGSL